MSLNTKNRPFYVLDLDEYVVAEYSSQEKCAKEMKLQVSKFRIEMKRKSVTYFLLISNQKV